MAVTAGKVGKRHHSLTAASAAAKAAETAHRAAALAVLTTHPSRLRSAFRSRRRASCDSGYPGSECPSRAYPPGAAEPHQQRQLGSSVGAELGAAAGAQGPMASRAGSVSSPAAPYMVPAAAPSAPAETGLPVCTIIGRAIGESSVRRSSSITSDEESFVERESAGGPGERQSAAAGAESGHRVGTNGIAGPSRVVEPKGESLSEPLQRQELSGRLVSRGSGGWHGQSGSRPGGAVEPPEGSAGGTVTGHSETLMVVGAPEPAGETVPRAQAVHVPAIKPTNNRQGGQPSPISSGGSRAGALAAALLALSETRTKLKEPPPPPPPVITVARSGPMSPLVSPSDGMSASEAATRLPPVANPHSRSSLSEPLLSPGGAAAAYYPYGNPANADPSAAALGPSKPPRASGASPGAPAAWRSCNNVLSPVLAGAGDRGDSAFRTGANSSDVGAGGGALGTRQSTDLVAPGLARYPSTDGPRDSVRSEGTMAEWVAQRLRASSVHLQPLKTGARSSAASCSPDDGPSRGLRALLVDRGEAASWYARPVRL